MENVFIDEQKVLLITFAGLFVLVTFILYFFYGKVKDKTLIGKSMREIDDTESISENEKFNLAIIHNCTIFVFLDTCFIMYLFINN